MKKTITILSALAMTASPALALNVVNHKTQNLQNILNPSISKSNVTVNNDIVVQSVSSYQFYFQARLNNSNYNGFPGFMSQISVSSSAKNWVIFFFQWLDDNDFHCGPFYDLNKYTNHGFFHNPMIFSNRLEEHMGHFGFWLNDKSETAFNMLTGKNNYKYFASFGKYVVNTYNNGVATGKVAGIMLNFGFLYGNGYTVLQPNCALIMNS